MGRGCGMLSDLPRGLTNQSELSRVCPNRKPAACLKNPSSHQLNG